MSRHLVRNAALVVSGLLAGAVLVARPIAAGSRASLETLVLELTSRVEALERAQGTSSRVTAPFTVMGKDGKPILVVTDNVAAAAWARVTIGGSASGHSVVAVSADGKQGGAGAVLVAEPDGRGSMTIRNATGEPLVRAGQSGAGDGMFEVHDRAKRGIFVVTPSLAGAPWARVTVGAGVGGMSALMVSQDGKVGGGGVLITADAGASPGAVIVRATTGKTLSALTGNDGGVLVVRDAADKERVRIDQKGVTVSANATDAAISLLGSTGNPLARIGLHPEGKDAALMVMNAAGTPVGVLRATGDAGAMSVMNGTGKAVAGLLGGGTAGGTVAVATGAGATMARMTVSDDGRGLFQVQARNGGGPIAVLTQHTQHAGGLLQIYNAGTSVANLTVGGTGAGYFQLSDASGTPTVEAGTLTDGNGTVRAGPQYQCLPVTLSGPISFVPNCIMGGARKQ
jgi:hypothetical protein